LLLAEQKDAYAWLYKVSQSLNYSQRLHQREEFERALKSKAITDKWLALHIQPNTQAKARLGIVVSKRLVPKATSRNMIKRLIREEFRVQLSQSSLNLVVRLRKNVLADEKVEFRKTLSSLLIKAGKRKL